MKISSQVYLLALLAILNNIQSVQSCDHDHSHDHSQDDSSAEHTHHHEHHHEHAHDEHEYADIHGHGHDHCCNIHKKLVRWVIAATHADQVFDYVDGFMRPLPFLAQSLISTTFISVVPIFLIYAMNVFMLGDGKKRESFTYVLLSFALGGLLGDVFFHTIPHLSSGHSHDHGHGHGGDSHGHAGHAHSEEDM